MRGASSSHCAAALRIGRIARDLMDGDITEVLIEFDRNGALPTTHESQGSDMGLFGGLLGWYADDERLPRSADALKSAGVDVCIRSIDVADQHPSTYRLTLKNSREEHSLIAVSTGGGMIDVISIDGLPARMNGGYNETLIWLSKGTGCDIPAEEIVKHDAGELDMLQVKAARFVADDILRPMQPACVKRIHRVLPVASRSDISVPFSTCSEMMKFDDGRNDPLWELAITYESQRGRIDRAEVLEMMGRIVAILRSSMAGGLAGTNYDDRILGCQSGNFSKALKEGRLLDAGALNRIILYVSAMMEVKSSMGVIVAMPTAGACAALPGAVLAMADEMQLSDDDVSRAFLAGGLIGVFIASRWTFAAEAGGCQAECGSAAAMAAAALVTLAGGSLKQSTVAASMAMQSMLGLVCDPVANRVEVPCLGKNAMAAANALSCANMALAGYSEVIPLDEVIEAAKRIGAQLPRELRCTALGGLSISSTSKHIEKDLAARKCGRASGKGINE